MARNRPATGLPSGHSAASRIASQWRRRCSASRAASPNATPMANGSRLVKSRVAVPAPNQIVPQRARSSPNQPRASGAKSAAEETDAIASASGGASSPAGGGGGRPGGGGGGG